MGIKFTNNAFGTLAAPITAVATSLTLTAGQGARFPVITGGDYFYATLVDAAVNIEIVKVTARTVDTLTIERGQDNTAALAYTNGDRLELRPTNASLRSLAQETETFTAAAGTGTYTASLDPIPKGYYTNQVYRIFFASANASTPPTLNLNALGAKTIKRPNGTTLLANVITAGLYAYLLYDGTDFLILNLIEYPVIPPVPDTEGIAIIFAITLG